MYTKINLFTAMIGLILRHDYYFVGRAIDPAVVGA